MLPFSINIHLNDNINQQCSRATIHIIGDTACMLLFVSAEFMIGTVSLKPAGAQLDLT